MKINFLLTYIHTKSINLSNPVVLLFLTFESVDEILKVKQFKWRLLNSPLMFIILNMVVLTFESVQVLPHGDYTRCCPFLEGI